MKLWKIIPLLMAGMLVVVLLSSQPEAFERYQDGCNSASCHGDFTSDQSTKTPPSVFLSGSKHEMHRSSGEMNTECNLCHTNGDNRNPFTGSSQGTAANAGLGCTGCHNAAGLRLHHENNGVPDCISCHGSATPPSEDTIPPYYGTVDTNADGPCNPTAAAQTNENWTDDTVFEGLDNDGDNLYDGFDPDCAPSGTPGETGLLIVNAHDKVNGILTLNYGVACGATDNSVEFGDLSQVSTPTYSGRTCAIGNTGTVDWSYGAGSMFYLIVADDGSVDGSYGLATSGERTPDPAGCFLQNLTARCD